MLYGRRFPNHIKSWEKKAVNLLPNTHLPKRGTAPNPGRWNEPKGAVIPMHGTQALYVLVTLLDTESPASHQRIPSNQDTPIWVQGGISIPNNERPQGAKRRTLGFFRTETSFTECWFQRFLSWQTTGYLGIYWYQDYCQNVVVKCFIQINGNLKLWTFLPLFLFDRTTLNFSAIDIKT